MNPGFIIVNIIGVIMSAFIVFKVYRSISSRVKVNLAIELTGYFLFVCIHSVVVTFVNISVLMSLSFVALVFLLSLLYEISWLKRIFYVVILILTFILSEMLVGFIASSFSSMTIEDMQQNLFYFMLATLGSKLIAQVIVLFIKPILSNTSYKLSKGLYCSMILLPIATTLIIFATSELTYRNDDPRLSTLMAVGVCGVVIANFVLVYLIEKQIKTLVKAAENQMVTQALIQQTKYYSDLVEKHRVDNKRLHDIDNQLMILKSMVAADAVTVSTELQKADKLVKESKKLCFTNIVSVDAMLNNINDKAEKAGVRFEKSIFLSALNNIEEMDFCLLLGNLLDNAVEECERAGPNLTEPPYIKCVIKQIDAYIQIIIENPFDSSVLHKKTQKQDKYKHSYGLQIINDIVEKYNGNLVVSKDLGIYKTIILLSTTE